VRERVRRGEREESVCAYAAVTAIVARDVVGSDELLDELEVLPHERKHPRFAFLLSIDGGVSQPPPQCHHHHQRHRSSLIETTAQDSEE
jgi:hypothetical protein